MAQESVNFGGHETRATELAPHRLKAEYSQCFRVIMSEGALQKESMVTYGLKLQNNDILNECKEK
jgi:hypothetical protein